MRQSARALGLVVCCATPAMAGEVEVTEPGPPGNGGLYVRVSLGAGYAYVARETESRGPGGSFLYLGDSSSIRGALATTTVSVGGTLASGFVVAGTWCGFSLPGAALTLQDDTEVDLDAAMTGFYLGPTVQVYPTSHGFHFGGGAGYLTYGVEVAAPPGGLGGQGAAAVGHVGWDLWIDREWAVGLSLRGLLGRVGGSDQAGDLEVHEVATVQQLGLDVSVLLY